MRFVMVALALWAGPVMAEETHDRATPVFGLDEGSKLRSFHLPDALVPGGRLLRVQFEAGFVDVPWDETYVIETNADGRPAILRHEVRVWSGDGLREREGGARELTEAEVERINEGIRSIRLCGSGPDRRLVVDAPMVLFEFVNESRYCFVARVPWEEIEPEYGAFFDLVQGMAGGEGP